MTGEGSGEDEGARAALDRIAASLERPPLSDAVTALRAGQPERGEKIARDYLENRAEEPGALWLLASAAGMLGRVDEAEALLRRTVALAPPFTAARSDLVRMLQRGGKIGEGLDEAERMLANAPQDATLLGLKAGLLIDAGRAAEAIAVTRALLGRFPNEPAIWMSYGHLLKTVGRTEEAVEAYRESLRLRPTQGVVWWSLANLKTVRLEAGDMRVMERLLREAPLSPYDRLHLHFTLGKALTDEGRAEEAFRHYCAGNRLRRARAPHDAAAVTRFVERSEALFTGAFLASLADAGSSAADPIFIVGMPRSGSTLVEQILASHPAIEATMELQDLPRLAGRIADYPDGLATLSRDALRQLGRDYIAATRVQRRTDRPFFIDKLPANWLHVGLIHMILPRAKIIDVRRHPLACGFSNFAQQFERGQEFAYDLGDIGAYYRDYVRMMRHFDAVLPGRVHRVVYEQLLDAPEGVVRGLLEHVAVPFDAACLAFHETERAIHTPSAEQVRRPLNREGLERWRAFEPWLGPMKAALGPVLDAYPDVPDDRSPRSD